MGTRAADINSSSSSSFTRNEENLDAQTIVQVEDITRQFEEEIRQGLLDLENDNLSCIKTKEEMKSNPNGKQPKLLGIVIEEGSNYDEKRKGSDNGKQKCNETLAKWVAEACGRVGIGFELLFLDPNHNNVDESIIKANEDPDISGILLLYPTLLSDLTHNNYRDLISYKKDVGGLCFTYRNNLYRNTRFLDHPINHEIKCLLPCTSLGCIKILEHLNVFDTDLSSGKRLEGKAISVLNRSDLVGRPLAAMAANDGAVIYSIDPADENSIFIFENGHLNRFQGTPEEAINNSDVVILSNSCLSSMKKNNLSLSSDSQVPISSSFSKKSSYLDNQTSPIEVSPSWIKDNAVVLNLSNQENRTENESLWLEELLKNKRNIKYVPYSGKVAATMICRNAFRLYKNFHDTNASYKNFDYEDHFMKYQSILMQNISAYIGLATL